MESDGTLYRRYLGGDEKALRYLMERFGDVLTFYINGYVKNIYDAEDLMIDTFAYIVSKRPHIHNGAFKAYLFKAARNSALRFLQRQRRYTVFSLDEAEHEPENHEILESVVQNSEKSRILHFCMGNLQPDYREALFLVYFEGLSYREAACVMKKTEKQIDKLLQSGKKHLRTALEKKGITDAYN